MIYGFLGIMIFFVSPSFAKSSLPDDLIGKWQAVGYFYQGSFIQPKDPRLTLTYEFFPDGKDILYWKNKDETSFCERRGSWLVQDGTLVDEVVWVNPQNGMDCSNDPDMQTGKISISPFWVEAEKLQVEIPLGSEVLIYVWEKINEPK